MSYIYIYIYIYDISSLRVKPHCCLLLSWKSWNRFECAVGGLRHPQRINALCGQNVEFLDVKLVVHIVTSGL